MLYKAGSRAVEPFILHSSGLFRVFMSHWIPLLKPNLVLMLELRSTYLLFHYFFPCWFWRSALQVPWLFRTELGLHLTNQNIICRGAELLTLLLEPNKVSQLSALFRSGPFVLSGHTAQLTPNHTAACLHHRNQESANSTSFSSLTIIWGLTRIYKHYISSNPLITFWLSYLL